MEFIAAHPRVHDTLPRSSGGSPGPTDPTRADFIALSIPIQILGIHLVVASWVQLGRPFLELPPRNAIKSTSSCQRPTTKTFRRLTGSISLFFDRYYHFDHFLLLFSTPSRRRLSHRSRLLSPRHHIHHPTTWHLTGSELPSCRARQRRNKVFVCLPLASKESTEAPKPRHTLTRSGLCLSSLLTLLQ